MLKHILLISLVTITAILIAALAIVFSGFFSPAPDDAAAVEDTSDTTMSPQGTTRYLLLQDWPVSDPMQAALNLKLDATHTSTYDHNAYDTVVTNAANLITLTGMPADSTHFGTFTGSLIPDDSQLKAILQLFETTIEGLGGGHDPVSLDANADAFMSMSVQEIGLDSQAANTVLAGPAGGGPAVPGFRALTADDMPDLSDIYRPLVVLEAADLADTSSPHDMTTLEMAGGVISKIQPHRPR